MIQSGIDTLLGDIKGLFIPEKEELLEAMDDIKTLYQNKFGGVSFDVISAIGGSEPMKTRATTITIGGLSFKVPLVDWSFVHDAVDYFRPYIRGLMVLFLCLYNYNQFMGLIGQPGLSLGLGGLLKLNDTAKEGEGKQ